MPKFQSAYRLFHSTQTALIKIFNDFLLAADQGQVSALCLLDRTSAFDTVDHTLLLTRLQRGFGVQGGCLAWFASYLSGRSYCVVIDGVASHVIHIMCSVPQGSVLGPLLSCSAVQQCRPDPPRTGPVRGGSGRHCCTAQLDVTCVRLR